ncbi:MAG TPA: assimilatory sulfite reductase (NADPH) flavoprotein subunit [Dokdonella sp.]|uniref:assimilatory sulfite reductase (NADPH) flavoprotein subunit n=1 Tax=Dokdonella sp. TaxID=2291710 RepID=UPI002C62BEE9|nr:assimilatory sulfite reductase (NADPH) flavoprotein subunit [Dokdonella sp.]HUD43400.1 assimilatory sulfite reductase (NADPH) flavoprotein subunit [Dokdonella sp.]
MSALPARPATALSPDTLAQLTRLTEGLDRDALQWASGYLAGLAAHTIRQAASVPSAAAAAAIPATIVYGSQTGNARRQAEALARELEQAGLPRRVLRADAYPLRELPAERLLYVVVSTQGDGDPPDDARAFVEHLTGRRAPRLPQLRYAVLGLGDSSYPKFCAVGTLIDERLAALGAERLFARGEADVDVDTAAASWRRTALTQAQAVLEPTPALATVTPLRGPAAPADATAWSRKRPFRAPLLSNRRIVGRDSAGDVRHVELSLQGSNLDYRPGDALGVWPTQPPGLVEAVLAALGADREQTVTIAGETLPLAQWLAARRELTRLTRPFVAAHAQRARSAVLDAALAADAADALRALLDGHQLIDLLQRYPAAWDAADLVAALRPLAPRLYSIASSRAVVGDEVHLTVAVVGYEAFGQARAGTASRFLADRGEDDAVPVFVEPNERFRLPEDPARDIVMIGAGTGVAPFRAFVQERSESGAAGRNWLFFGHRHFRLDFLYQTEWQQAHREGHLHRVDLAFSRDRPEKVYVQHALRRRGRELYDWIENGAHLYVCGDASRMARDVDAALREIAVAHGGHDAESAAEWVAALAADRRYGRDVY